MNAYADRVIGQPDFVTKTAGTTSVGLNHPNGVCVSAADTLFVADTTNNRVFGYKQISNSGNNGPAADLVIGSMSLNTVSGGLSQTLLNSPQLLS